MTDQEAMTSRQTDQEAQYAAILANPHDDGLRLLYAEMLDEQRGCGERAEFVQVQVELARATCLRCDNRPPFPCPMAGQCPKSELRRRENELRNEVMENGRQEEWFPGWKGWHLTTDKVQYERMGRQSGLVSRGFISHVTASWADWQAHADKLTWWGERKCGCGGLAKMHRPSECPLCRGTGSIPGATMPCPACQLHGRNMACTPCSGFGRVTRPVSLAMQPVEMVTFIDWPNLGQQGLDAEDWAMMGRANAAVVIERGLRERWPSVEIWNLPTVPPITGVGGRLIVGGRPVGTIGSWTMNRT